MAPKNSRQPKSKDLARRAKKKISPISSEGIEYVDYKDVEFLRRFLSDRAKIRGRYASGNDAQQQRVIGIAIKNAREMGLLPYASRVTTMRRGRGRRDDERSNERDNDRNQATANESEETAEDVNEEAQTPSAAESEE